VAEPAFLDLSTSVSADLTVLPSRTWTVPKSTPGRDATVIRVSPAGEEVAIRVTHLSLAECLARSLSWVGARRETRTIVCANPHCLYLASRDASYAGALHSADLVLPDGVGVTLASRLFGWGIGNRITGSDIFHAVNSAAASTAENRVFLLGSTTHVLEEMARRIVEMYPGLEVAGFYSPPFKDSFDLGEVVEMAERVNKCRPDILWVGMTAPKQEKWINDARPYLEVPFVGAVGAVFEYVAGTQPRPGRFVRRLGLEWLFRLLREPRRLWRRTFVSAPRFLWLAYQASRGDGGGLLARLIR
jgi:N-acetylglucosaminyldiphosphoundecaprenol N-acetyl-beta-D-mannosaminyltransferase